jgi:hypothetical protein
MTEIVDWGGPYISMAVFCRHAETAGNQITRIDEPGQQAEIPVELIHRGLAVTMIVRVIRGKALGLEVLTVRQIAPDGSSATVVNHPIMFGEASRTDIYVHKMEIPTRVAGEYQFEFYLNEQFMTRIPFWILHRPGDTSL